MQAHMSSIKWIQYAVCKSVCKKIINRKDEGNEFKREWGRDGRS